MTEATNHHVIFEGRITGEIGLAEVKRNLAAMFKMNEAQVESLFSGKPVVIKRDVDAQTAQKYAAAFKKAGAVCKIAGSGGDTTAAKPSARPVQPKAAPPASAAPGPQTAADLSRRDVVNIKVPGDLGGLSMGEPGEESPVLSNEMQADIPDTAGLSVAMDDGYLAPEKNIPEPKLDISNLSIKKDD
jgi:hypothetical protein